MQDRKMNRKLRAERKGGRVREGGSTDSRYKKQKDDTCGERNRIRERETQTVRESKICLSETQHWRQFLPGREREREKKRRERNKTEEETRYRETQTEGENETFLPLKS